MREVASLRGHASIDTTTIHADQDAIDLVRALALPIVGLQANALIGATGYDKLLCAIIMVL